jgi:hypothetical protein
MRTALILATLLSTAMFSAAQTQPDRGGPSSREQRYQMFQDYLIRRAREVTRNNLADVKSLEDWESRRPEVRRQVLYMLGLDPMPKKTPLATHITGQFERTLTASKRSSFSPCRASM